VCLDLLVSCKEGRTSRRQELNTKTGLEEGPALSDYNDFTTYGFNVPLPFLTFPDMANKGLTFLTGVRA